MEGEDGAVAVAEPVDGVVYPITLGATFTQPGSANESYHLLQYTSFKPASLNEDEPGLLQYAKGGTVLAEFLSKSKAGEVVKVQGHYTELKEVECVLIFDGSSFRLERLAGCGRRMNALRPSRTPAGGSAAASSAPPPTASAPSAHSASSSVSATPQKNGGTDSAGPASASSSASASPSSVTTSPTSVVQSTVSHKRPRSVASKSLVSASMTNGTASKRLRADSGESEDDSDDENASGGELNDSALMDFDDDDADKPGDEDILSLASELESGLIEDDQAASAIAEKHGEDAESLFSENEDEEPQERTTPPPAAAGPQPPPGTSGKSLPSASSPDDSDSESDSDSGSGSDSESDSDSGSSGSDSDSESE